MTRIRKPLSWNEIVRDSRVESWSDERGPGRDPGDGLWVYLKRPWWNHHTSLACIHEYTVAEVIAQLHKVEEEPELYAADYGPAPPEAPM